MWERGWRKDTWKDLTQDWDVIVIGGGITGAGVYRRSVSEGFRTLLVEANDFAFGTSSRSSKMVHGGFRYLRNKQFDVTKESVREREWMLKEARNLVTPLGFVMPCPSDLKISSQFAIGVVIYDLLAPKWKHKFLTKKKIIRECPSIESGDLKGGFLYYDAEMDDARLVLRIIREATFEGGTALNYAKVENLLKNNAGIVCGIVLKDLSSENQGTLELKARVVINATGPWSDSLRQHIDQPSRLRKLRGSHLIFPRERLPLTNAVTLLHPKDRRAMFALPWEGVSIIGTTDLDHGFNIDAGEPFATASEIEYILEAGISTFPGAGLTHSDVISSFSGLRPVINTGIADPSKESRAHVVWEEEGLITVTGGKLTTFRIMAEQALAKASEKLPNPVNLEKRKRYFNRTPDFRPEGMVLAKEFTYLIGRYGAETNELLNSAHQGENEPIEYLPNLWSEVRWAAKTGGVEHLDDLLLRRVRLGMLLPDGAKSQLSRIKTIAQSELGWDDSRWNSEASRYQMIYENSYSSSPKGFER